MSEIAPNVQERLNSMGFVKSPGETRIVVAMSGGGAP
jgi:hypothetical protein